MRLFKILAKKCFRDVLRNIKQFIAIIFIIGISVTLYIGLEANAESLEQRVNLAYSEEYGNLADIWITFSPSYEDISNGALEEEQINIQEIIGDDSSFETRLYIPAKVEDSSSYGLISYELPTINQAYNIDVEYSLSNSSSYEDFFYVDYSFIENHLKTNGMPYEIGDEVAVTFDLTYFEGIDTTINNLIIDNYDSFVEVVSTLTDMSQGGNGLSLVDFLENNKTQLIEVITSQISNYFLNNSSIELDIEITGTMNHPENLQSESFYGSHFLMGSKTLISAVIEKVGSMLNPSNLQEVVNELFSGYDVQSIAIRNFVNSLISDYGEELDLYFNLIYSYALNYLNDPDNDEAITYIRYIYNQYVIKLSDDLDLDEVVDKLNNYFNSRENLNNPTTSTILAILDKNSYPSCLVLANDITQARQMSYIFPLIFFVVAVLVVLTTITQMILKERTQIGTMKALGISKVKIFSYYSILFSIVSLIGVLFGFIVGPILVPLVMNVKYGLLYQLPSFTYVFPAFSSILTLFVVLGLVILITFAITYKELRLAPVSSMRHKTPSIKMKKTKQSKIKNSSVMMGFRNIRVHFTKSIMVIIGVMGCCGLLICGIGIEDTLDYGVQIDMANVYGADIEVTYASNLLKGSIGDQIEDINGVDTVYEYAKLSTTTIYGDKSSTESLYLFSKETTNISYASWDYYYEDEDGTPYNNCGLSKAIAEDLDVKEGDVITVTYNTSIYYFRVAEIFYTFAARAIYVYEETLEIVAYRSACWVNVLKDNNENWLVDSDVLVELINSLGNIASLSTYEDSLNTVEGFLSSIRYMTNTVKVFALLLAIVVLFNLSILNYEERLRDLATLKVLGFSRKEIGASLIVESMALTLIGSICGMFIGYPLEYMVLASNATKLVAWNYVIYWPTFLIAFVVSLAVSFGVNLLLTSRINKIQMSESLKSIE